MHRLVSAMAAFATLILCSHATQAQNFQAVLVAPIDGIVECKWARDRIITVISGPCDDYTAPRQVRLGETFSANGKIKTIGFIVATRLEKDIPKAGMKAGDWYCAAGESKADIPALSGKREHTGTWLYIPKCQPYE